MVSDIKVRLPAGGLTLCLNLNYISTTDILHRAHQSQPPPIPFIIPYLLSFLLYDSVLISIFFVCSLACSFKFIIIYILIVGKKIYSDSMLPDKEKNICRNLEYADTGTFSFKVDRSFFFYIDFPNAFLHSIVVSIPVRTR